jgi:hypothetical protein
MSISSQKFLTALLGVIFSSRDVCSKLLFLALAAGESSFEFPCGDLYCLVRENTVP